MTATGPIVDAEATARIDVLDRWITPEIRVDIEERFWAPIERLTSLEAAIADRSFVDDPGAHLCLYADHGPAHARDVAGRAASLADWAFGTLLPARPPERAEFVTGVAVLLAMLHDVGMCLDPPVGRRLHAQYATQFVYSSRFADVLDELLRTDAGRLRSGLERLDLYDPLANVAKEVLACAVAHSKSAIPAALLDDRSALRTVLQYIRRTELPAQLGATERSIDNDGSFAWLTAPEHTALADDVVDAIRLVRSADALRQRGTTLRTSSGFEVVVDARTGYATTVLRSATGRSAYILELDHPIVTGEANIRGAELDASSLRFDFHRGAITTEAGARKVATAVAGVIDDVQLDILPTFPASRLQITLVAPVDRPDFADDVRRQVVARRPELTNLVEIVPGRLHASVPPLLDWRRRGRRVDDAQRDLVLRKMAEHGTRIAHDPGAMFDGAVIIEVEGGEILIQPGEHASFVLVPFEPGIEVAPLGGFRPAVVHSWIPVGTIGVLRGHDRNSRVTATTAMEVLVIPDHLFLERWAEPFDTDSLVAHIAEWPIR